ncbi:hypothetical protein BSLG_005888 [Batrachochytrium salamandrivorans]|nr:hypothetical protein BSLG_005888 [Batrachochytrium salamandrivorans]
MHSIGFVWMNHSGVPVGAVQLVSSRDVVDGLLKMDGLIDLVILRGGAGLVKHVRESTNKVVDSFEETISHINTMGQNTPDVIVTCNKQTASRFMAQVDAGSVYWNASTRFTDGFRYGFGAEIGVSTTKLM